MHELSIASAVVNTAEKHAAGRRVAVVTMTTVGYGDRVPVTAEGRLVGVFLMVTGVVLVGTFSGLAASWFLAPAARRNRTEIESLAHEVARMREALERAAPGLASS